MTETGHGHISIPGCRMLRFARTADARGILGVIEGGQHVPFQMQRLFYIHGVQAGITRGSHAHRTLQQCFVAMSGRFMVELDDGTHRDRIDMSDPHLGLYVPPLVWVVLSDFSADAVCLVLASAHYDESDYIRDRGAFLKSVAK